MRFDALRDRYLTIDPRGLGAGRISLATVLLLDLVRRFPLAALWYSNQGLLPNHTVLWRPSFPYVFSLFFTASRPYEALIGFGLCGAAYVMLLVGNRTRLAHMASLLAVLSLHGRVLFIQNSGDVVLVEICLWTLFLPLGRRYSVDSLRARVRLNPGLDVSDLFLEGTAPPDRTPVVSSAVLALVAQLAVIYLLNAIQKNGRTWRDGSAVHYVLYYANVVTPLGVLARSWITPTASQLLSWSSRFTEAVLPFLLLMPVAQGASRRLAIALVVALHVAFSLFLNLGIFVPAMLVFTPFLVTAPDWDRLERWWGTRGFTRRSRAMIARTLTTLERRGLLRLTTPTPERSSRGKAPAPRGLVREGAVFALMTFATVGVMVDNSAVTHVPASLEPRGVYAIRVYLQMFQSWSLFAPDVPTSEGTVAVDAVTAEGRHVDPLNEELSPGAPWLGDAIPSRLGNNGFASAYLLRLPTRPEYFTALGEWLLRYPDRTRRDADRIVSFRVLTLEQDDPPPGHYSAGTLHSNVLFRYPN